MTSSKTFAKIGLVVCIVSLTIQLLGFSCPGWVAVSIDLSLIGVSSGLTIIGFGQVVTESAVWFVRVCVYGDISSSVGSCSTVAQHDNWEMGFMLSTALFELRSINWLSVQIELTLALVFCVAGLVIIIISLCDVTYVSDRALYIVAAVCMLISGALVFPAVISVGLAIDGTVKAATTLTDTYGQNLITMKAPWALALSAAGLVLAILACILFTIAAFKIKKKQFAPSIFPTSYLSPAILKIGNFPATISLSDRYGHMPPSFRKSFSVDGLPPRIGCKDDEPLSFQNMGLEREQTFEPYVLFPSTKKDSSGTMYPLGDTVTQNSEPPPYKCFGDTEIPKLPGSVCLHRDTVSDSEESEKAPNRSPKSPRSKTMRMSSIHEDDLTHDIRSVQKRSPTLTVTPTSAGVRPTNHQPRAVNTKSRSPTADKKTVRVTKVNGDTISNVTESPGKGENTSGMGKVGSKSTLEPHSTANTFRMGKNKSPVTPRRNKVGSSGGTTERSPNSPRKSITIPKLQIDEVTDNGCIIAKSETKETNETKWSKKYG